MQQIALEIQDKLNSEITKEWKNGHVPKAPCTLISNSFNLAHHCNDLLGVVPEILCGYIAGGGIREDVILKNSENSLSLNDRKGVLLCHALSPYSESIGFYCDLGRVFRVAKGLKLPMNVMLAGRQWAEYNWVVKDLKLSLNLTANEEWRVEIYRNLLGAETDVLTIDDVLKVYGVDVKRQANDYVSLLTKMFGPDISERKFTDVEVEDILSEENFLFEIAKLSILRKEIQPIQTTIECVLRNFKRADEETLTYFLTQYFHQSKYNGFIKLSMKREKDFDDSFRKIHNDFTNSKISHDDLIGLYLEDYKYGIHEGKHVTVHPYYFPSGTLYSIYQKDLRSEVENCIMISDFDKKEKIFRILSGLTYFQRARIVSDLLSFGHAMTVRHYSVKDVIAKWFKKKGRADYYFYSWETFTNKTNQDKLPQFISDWTNLIFTNWAIRENFPIPYWFLPYFWDNEKATETTRVTIGDQVDLVSILLTEAYNKYGLPILANDPLRENKYKKN